MITSTFVRSMFSRIDDQDLEGFIDVFAESGLMRFGNAPALVGKKNIRDAIGGFFSAIDSLQHKLEEIWTLEDATICHGEVTYTRLDGSKLSVPFAVILKGQDDAITDYLIFVDNSALFES